jgi:two-component system, sensor histidine kinase and response regulator
MKYLSPFLLFLSFTFSLFAKEEIRFGVFAYKGVEETRNQYQPLVEYLNEKLEKRVVLEVLTQEEMNEKISEGKLDVATTNPTHFLFIRKKHSLSGALATFISASDGGKPSQKLAGVIVVRADSPIKTIKDIRGKTIAIPSFKHMGGYRAQVYELHLNGVEISPKTNQLIEVKGAHQEVVRAILDNKAEIGFIRDGILENMIQKGEIDQNGIRIINEKKEPLHPYRLSTRLYPEWPVFALTHTDPEDTKAFLGALLSLKPTNSATLNEGIYGYALPADYLEVEELARHLRLPPFDNEAEISYRDVWESHKETILVLGGILLLITFFYLYEKRRKNLFESLLANMGDGVYGVDSEGNFTWVNDQALRMIGYSRKEALSKNQLPLFHRHTLSDQRYESPVYLTLKDQKSRSKKDYFARKDGTLFPVTLTVAPNHNGGAIVVFSDDSISDEQEAKFEKSNMMLESLLRAIPDLIWMKDPDGVYLTCNKRFEDFFGAPILEIIGKTDYDFVSRELADFFREHDRKAMYSPIPISNFEEVPFASDGHREYLNTTKTSVKDKEGNIIGVMGIGRNYTAFKASEEALRESYERFEKLIRSVPGTIFQFRLRLDGSSAFPMATEQIWDMYEVTPQEVSDDASKVFSRIHIDDIDHVQTSITRSAETLDVWENIFRVILPIRGERWIKGVARPEREEDGSILWHGYLHDVTEEIIITEELERAKHAAEEANRSKSEFLANMSHEIRTPMNAIIGLSELMMDGSLEPHQLDYLIKINGSSKMLLAIINDILDYSKIEADKLRLESKPFKIESILSQMRVLFVQNALKKGIQLYFYMKNDVPGTIIGDEFRLDQVLVNLIANALKFTHEGSVILEIELVEKKGENTALIGFKIIDTGIGMSEEELSLLFRPFTQADSSTTRKYGGTGLGLSISKRLVNAMGGVIEVESTKGLGTTFSFTIEADVENWEQEHPKVNRIDCKALVVDDQEISRIILETMLQNFGCTTASASNGREALEMIRAADEENVGYEIILMDWKMPEMDGKEALKEIKRLKEEGRLKSPLPFVVMQSGYLLEEIRLEDIPVEVFLSKPITESELFDAINRARSGLFFTKTPFTPHHCSSSLDGLKILFVEDNELNQEVVSKMLQREGVEVHIAKNGQEAVTLYLSNPRYFDLILMDVQMPIMGGYEATRLIREHDSDIPIIALTAAAMVEDKEKALQVGMNDHMSKPIEMVKLYALIAKWCNRSLDILENPKTTAIEEGYPILDKGYLLSIVNGDEAALARLLRTFILQLENEFSSLSKIIKNGSDEGKGLIHALKGVSGNVGAKELAEKCRIIDTHYKNNQVIPKEDIEALEDAIEKLKTLIVSIVRDERRDAKEVEMSPQEIHTLFEEIKYDCENFNITNQEKIDILREKLADQVAENELIEWSETMERFMYQRALEIMKGWSV